MIFGNCLQKKKLVKVLMKILCKELWWFDIPFSKGFVTFLSGNNMCHSISQLLKSEKTHNFDGYRHLKHEHQK